MQQSGHTAYKFHFVIYNIAPYIKFIPYPSLRFMFILKYPIHVEVLCSVTRKKLQNVYKSCPKMFSLEKLQILTPLQKLPKNVWYLGKLIVAKGFKKWTKVQ